MLSFGGLVSNTEEFMDRLVSVDEKGNKNEKQFNYLLIAMFFVFLTIYAMNSNNGTAAEFKANGVLTTATIEDGEQTRSGRRSSKKSTLKVLFQDNAGQEQHAEIDIKNEDFDKYSLGQTLKIKYLPNDPSLIEIEK
jgi:hypothetical protein